MSDWYREYLLNRRWILIHEYGHSPYRDGIVRQEIEKIDRLLAQS